jgi:misacylated tRNA(Ala) deacylase
MSQLYLKDAYLKECEATVLEIHEGKFVVLDKTVLYAQGGGQPHDTGKLVRHGQEFLVIFVGKFSGKISHQVQPENKLQIGDTVHVHIDWERRYRLMRMHTATHILAAVMHHDAGAMITGNQIGVEKTRIDFSLEKFDKEKVAEYVQKANVHIARNLDVTVSFMPREEAMQLPGMVKLAGALPPTITELRIVKIGDVDRQADGGTHVRNTSEIGKIVLVKCENKGKSNRRVHFTLE